MKFGCVVRDPLAMRYTQAKGVVMARIHFQERTFISLFRISGAAGRIALNFGSLVEVSTERTMLKFGVLLNSCMHFTRGLS